MRFEKFTGAKKRKNISFLCVALENLTPAGAKWVQEAGNYFSRGMGLNDGFSRSIAELYFRLHLAGLKPKITSGFRDPVKQQTMLDRWNRGDRVGLRHKPADPANSKHCYTDFDGSPCACAVDITSTDEKKAAAIARDLGLKAGLDFNDPGHYEIKT